MNVPTSVPNFAYITKKCSHKCIYDLVTILKCVYNNIYIKVYKKDAR